MKSKITNRARQHLILNAALLTLFSSCSIQKQISQSAKADVLDAKALQTAHVGISIFDPSTNKYLYNYQGDKYFVPASNIKIPTCYAAMKYLGDSLVGLRYNLRRDELVIYPTGDPTLLHKDFGKHNVIDFLKSKNPSGIFFCDKSWEEDGFGSGWSWNDYNETYMAERSSMPIYGNLVKFYRNEKDSLLMKPYVTDLLSDFSIRPDKNQDFNDSGVYWVTNKKPYPVNFRLERDVHRNSFQMFLTHTKFVQQEFPVYNANEWSVDVLASEINKFIQPPFCQGGFEIQTKVDLQKVYKIHSQPTDSLLKPMMHRSDNFFAEQSLLMVSNEMLGVMNDAKIIDTILKTDFIDLPQKPRWVDGSGLSRYNLFTPQDFVTILNKMKNEFGMDRIKVVFPTGGEGTISSFYKTDSGYIYGKTGTLSGVVAFSGFLYTKKGKLLIFSTLVNNHQATSTDVRKAMEKFLQGVRNKY